ncbi:MAG: LysE family transporter [Candidatus Omnitrophota bacterium]
MFLGILAGFLASCFGWQIDLIAIQRGLKRGRTAAFLVGCGAILADMMFLSIGFTGTQPLLDHPEYWGIIRWVGIGVILSLAARGFWAHGKSREQSEEVSKRNPTKNFLVGFLVVITNPVVLLMWVGIIGFLRTHFPEARALWFKELFLGGFLIGAMFWFVLLAFIFLKKLKRWSEENHSFLSRISSGVLVLVALYLIFFEKLNFS